jgi:hypothetical protein
VSGLLKTAQAQAEPAEVATSGPRLELRPVGDGRAFIRSLARSFVRRELIAAGVIATPESTNKRE